MQTNTRTQIVVSIPQAPSASRATAAKSQPKAKATGKAKGTAAAEARQKQSVFTYRHSLAPQEVKDEWKLAKKGQSTIDKDELYDLIVAAKGDYSHIVDAIRTAVKSEETGTRSP